MPNISLLIPLSEVLDVTVTELLKGETMPAGEKLEIGEVEGLVKRSMDLSRPERRFTPEKKCWIPRYLLTILICAAEVLLLLGMGWTIPELLSNVVLVIGLMLIIAFYFCFCVRERLPKYYDENKISVFCDGPLHMNMPGVTFNNRNWPHILKAVRISAMVTPVTFPLLFMLLTLLVGAERLFVLFLSLTLVFTLGGLFVPIYVAAWRNK